MISAKEDIKNTVTLEEKRYGSNSLVEDTYENSEFVNTIKTGGYGNLDILKLALAILVMLRHIGQNFFKANVFWRVYVINTISTIGVTSFL